jgi:CHAT domain-containing protein/Tfp pilus assembly protein PilF
MLLATSIALGDAGNGISASAMGRQPQSPHSGQRTQLVQAEPPEPEAITQARDLIRQAKTYESKGNYQQAAELWKIVISKIEKALSPEDTNIASSLNYLAILYMKQGRYVEAEPLLDRALVITEKALGAEHRDTSTGLMNLGRLYEHLGRYSEAEPFLKRALAIREKASGEEDPDTAVALGGLAGLYNSQGRYADAEQLYRRSLSVKERSLGPDNPSTVIAINDLAILYQQQGRYPEAEVLFKRALMTNEKTLGADHPDTALGLNNLAALYTNQGRYQDAEPLYRRALQIQERVLGVDHPSTASSLLNLGSLYQLKRSYNYAEPLYKRSLLINEKTLGIDHPGTAHSLASLASLYDDQGRYAEAEPLYKRSLAIREKALGPVHPDTAISLNNLALLDIILNKPEVVLPLLTRLNRSQANWLRRELPLQPRDLRMSLLKEQPDAIASTFALLHQDQSAAPLALETRLNRQGLIAEIEQRQRLLLASSPETRSLGERVAGLDRQLASSTLNPAQRDLLRKDRQQLEAELARQLPALGIDPVSTEQVASALRQLAPDGVLVEFQRYQPYQRRTAGGSEWGAPHYSALLLFPDGRIASIPLGLADPIDQSIRSVLKISADHQESPKAALLQVSNLLIKPLLPHLHSAKQLFISPDGELHRLPFSALPSPTKPDQVLSDTLKLRLITTGRDLIRLSQPAKPSSAPVVFANPDYGPPGLPWKPLTNTASEGQQIAAILRTTPITGSNATAEAVLTLRSPRILHIATHGFFQSADSNPNTDPLNRSGLVFSGANRPQSNASSDSILTAAEATALPLTGTDIVVLSACQTGLGDLQSGEGVYGLQRSLAVAGARSTLLSLWEVSDSGTAQFMQSFYTNLLKGQSRADALANTQAEFRNSQGAFSDEHYWAAFQLVGDWSPLRP